MKSLVRLWAAYFIAALTSAGTVAQGDTQAPAISAVSPAANASGISSSVNIWASFSENIQATSIVFTLVDTGGANIGGTISYDAATRTVTFDPAADLQSARTYTARVSGATDVAGNVMSTPRLWSFTVATVGFQDTAVLSGLTNPTAFQFSPDGRVFVAEKSGLIKAFASITSATSTVFADLRTNVHNFWDRGLLGMALHPQFPDVPYIYGLYTHDAAIGGVAPRWGTAGATSDSCPSPPGATASGCVVSGRLSRLEAAGNTMVGAEQVLIEDWFQQFPGHSIGGLAFGPDGALYATGGDGASFNFVDYGQVGNPNGDPPHPSGGAQTPPTAEGGALRSQDLRTRSDPVGLNGTLVRIDPDTGAAMGDNPLAGDADANARRIVAYGLRHAFRFTFRPGTREIWLGDVGWNSWEELNRVVDYRDAVVENFGWPCYEGALSQSGYDAAGLNLCEQLYADPGAVTPPFFSYPRSGQIVGAPCTSAGTGSVTGIAFYAGQGFPAEYDGALFFADYSRNCIWVMLPGSDGLPDPARLRTFTTGSHSPVDLKVHEGDLYYVDYNGGAIRRIRYFAGNLPPVAAVDATPSWGPAPLDVLLSASASSDAGNGSLIYAWDLDADGFFDDASAVSFGHTFVTSGAHLVRVRVTDEEGLSDIAAVLISTDNAPPTAAIDTPLGATTWRSGDSIAFSGHAIDPEQGALSAAALSWSLLLHHCPSACHVHTIQDFAGTSSGSFIAPDHEYPSHLELRLTAVDSGGLPHTASVILRPQTTTMTVQSSPTGLAIALGSVSGTAPFTTTVIAGSIQSITALSPQVIAGSRFHFASWSDGGDQTHVVRAGPLAATYTANFVRVEDTTALATPIALITAPAGGGSRNLGIIKDGVFPPVGSQDNAKQYDTYTGDATRTFDWIGHQFTAPHTFVGLTFQEGKQFSNGGWLHTLRVQVRSGGVWTDVTQLTSTPAYPGANGKSYETFELTFAPLAGDAIRVAGEPGGSARFFSIGELRVWAADDLVLPPSITVWVPNGGESWTVGATHLITWTATTTAAVNLFYQTASDQPWLPIAQNVSASAGRYEWRVPDTLTAAARVRVVSADPVIFDVSDQPFTITSTIKIMPLGDSITDGLGFPGGGGYRVGLWNRSQTSGISIDFVGSLTGGPATLPDKNHEGHGGWTIAGIAGSVAPWLAAHRPEVVLLMIGTNDIRQFLQLDSAPARLSALIDTIVSAAPEAFVVVAQITPFADARDEHAIAYNAAIPPMVRQKQASGAQVSYVDMHSPLVAADVPDGLHPNESGYNKMAAVWFDELLRLMSTNRRPQVTLTSPAANAVFQIPATVSLAASASDADGVIEEVTFYADATPIGTDRDAPYEVTWTGVAAGSYALTARARDEDGATTTSAAVSIVVDPLPTVTVTAADAVAVESTAVADPGEFTVARTGPTTLPLTVALSITGSATPDTDYPALSSSLTLPVGVASVRLAVVAHSDALSEGSETVVVTLEAGASYVIAAPGSAAVTISDSAVSPQRQDITALATPIALITAPRGGGSKNLAVIKDGVFPPVRSVDSTRQYDTYTGDATRTFDWIGHQFAAPHTFVGLTFQEGRQFPNGGWLHTLRVQVRSGGVWTDVTQLTSTPAYPGANGTTYETFELTFAPLAGDAIRVAGEPGGSARFFSVGELRVWAASVVDPLPAVTVTAADAVAVESTAVADPGEFTIARTGPTALPLTVALSITGSATPDTDYPALSSSLTLPVGVASVRLAVVAHSDALSEGSETVVVTLEAGASYVIAAPGSAAVTISDSAVSPQRQDITALATPIALITAPRGGGSKNLAVIKDGVFPPVRSVDSTRQYDTYTGDATRTFDWIGHQFAAPHTFVGLTFQEGRQFPNGGWLHTLRVQVRSGGVWTDVTQLTSTPAYPGANGTTYETFELTFAPLAGDAIRVAGEPGGSARFFSVGELRVWAR